MDAATVSDDTQAAARELCAALDALSRVLKERASEVEESAAVTAPRPQDHGDSARQDLLRELRKADSGNPGVAGLLGIIDSGAKH